MAEYIAGKGTTALGVIGTALGSLGVLSGGAGLLGMGGNRGPSGPFEKSPACMHDINCTKELMQKDAEIARLNSERYADGVGYRVYKELYAEMQNYKESQTNKWTEQAVINANQNASIVALNGQVAQTAATLAGITKTAVPKSAICNFGCTCGD